MSEKHLNVSEWKDMLIDRIVAESDEPLFATEQGEVRGWVAMCALTALEDGQIEEDVFEILERWEQEALAKK